MGNSIGHLSDNDIVNLKNNMQQFEFLKYKKFDNDTSMNDITDEQKQWVNDKILTRYTGYFNTMAFKFCDNIVNVLSRNLMIKPYAVRPEIFSNFFEGYTYYLLDNTNKNQIHSKLTLTNEEKDFLVNFFLKLAFPLLPITATNNSPLPIENDISITLPEFYYVYDPILDEITYVTDYPLTYFIIDKTLMDNINNALSAINLNIFTLSLPNNQSLNINNQYVVFDYFYYQFGYRLFRALENHSISIADIPNVDIFSFADDFSDEFMDFSGTEPYTFNFNGQDITVNDQLVIDNKMLEYFGIPYKDIEHLIIIGEVVAILIGLLTFGIGYLAKKLIQKALEIAYDKGAFNKLIDVLANALSDELGIPDITDAEAALDSRLDPVKGPLNKTIEHLTTITGISSVDFDTIPFEDAMKYSAVADKIFTEIDDIASNAENELISFISKIPGYIKAAVIYFIENVVTKPAFWGIVSGMIAFCVVAGKTCLKFLKKMCKAIAEKIRIFVKRNFDKIKKAFQNIVNQIKQNRSRIRQLISKIRQQYLKRQKKEAKNLGKLIKEEEKKIEDFLKKEFKDQLQEIKDKLHIDPISNKFDFGNYIENHKKFLAGSTAVGVGLLSAIMQRSDHFIGPLKELGDSLLNIGKYTYETSIILLVLLPFLIIQYICYYVIYVLEKNYLDRNKGLLV